MPAMVFLFNEQPFVLLKLISLVQFHKNESFCSNSKECIEMQNN